jgi:hypothetical protein
MSAFAANPNPAHLESIAKYILGRVSEKEPRLPDALRALAVQQALKDIDAPLVEHLKKQLALTELKCKVGMKQLGLGSAEISGLWNLLVSGMIEEEVLKRGSGTKPGIENRSFETFSKLPQIKGFLAPGDKLALWSGGIEISEYARNLGYCCLETTRLGGMFDQAKLYRNEQSLWQLWDYLAKAFVEQVGRFGEVHIFVRNFDRKSTLLTVEYPRLLEIREVQRAGFQIKWHVIVGDGDRPEQLKVLTDQGKLEVETPLRQFCFDDPGRAELALRSFLLREGKHFANAQRIMHTNRYSRPK